MYYLDYIYLLYYVLLHKFTRYISYGSVHSVFVRVLLLSFTLY